MRGLLFCLLVLSNVLSPVLAYGSRGAAERILYYYAYLAEEFTEPDENARKIGVGCPGSIVPTGRCTFNEFCEYIWKAQRGGSVYDMVRPNVEILSDSEVFEDLSVSSLYNRIVKWHDGVTGYGITGNSDNTRILEGSADYYDCLKRVAEPIGILSKMSIDDVAKNARVKKIVSNGQGSAQLLHDLRFQDLEKYRIRSVAKLLNVPVDTIQTRPGRSTYGVPGNWKTIDAPSTIAILGGNGKTRLNDAITTYQTGSSSAKEHWAAVSAADSAQRLSC